MGCLLDTNNRCIFSDLDYAITADCDSQNCRSRSFYLRWLWRLRSLWLEVSEMLRSKYKFSYDEIRIIVMALVEFKNQLIAEGRYTDAVDDLLIRFVDWYRLPLRLPDYMALYIGCRANYYVRNTGKGKQNDQHRKEEARYYRKERKGGMCMSYDGLYR